MIRVILALLVSGMLMAGCVTTTVNQEWTAPGSDYKIQSALVMGLPAGSIIGNQCSDEFVRQLGERGITAVPAYTVFPTGASKETVIAKAKETGRNAILVCRFLERRTQLDVYPGGGRSMLLFPDEVWYEPEYVENKYDVFATFLYDTATSKAVWSAMSDTYAGRNPKKISESYVKTMLKKMESQGIIAKHD